MSLRTLLLAALLVLLTSAAPASALPGDLDPTFDGDGIRVLDKLGLQGAQAVLVQPDGKIVFAANANQGGQSFAVARLHRDGALDTSFDDDGVAYVGLTDNAFARALTLQADGKLVVAGAVNGDIGVARLRPDGALDASFDGDGTRILDFGAYEEGLDVLVQPDGKIVVAGYSGPLLAPELVLLRLEPDGALDTSFDGDGVAGVNLGGAENGLAVARQADGRLVVAGVTSVNLDALVARFNRTGPTDLTLDRTFGPSGFGWRTIDYAGDDVAADVLVQPDGKLLVAGFGGSNTALTVTRLHPDGSFDPGFDADGTAGADFGGRETGTAAMLQPDGRIVLVGTTSLGDDMAVARLQPGGALDSTFSTDGRTTISLGADEYGYAVARQADGKIVIVGDTTGGTAEGPVVVRLQGDPAPVPGPAGGGAGADDPPRVTRLSVSPRRFRATGRRRGTHVRFRLSERARVTLTFERAVGRRWRRAGRLRLSGRQGANARRFSGRLAGHPLNAGRHRLRVLAVDAAGQRSRPRVARFRVLPSR